MNCLQTHKRLHDVSNQSLRVNPTWSFSLAQPARGLSSERHVVVLHRADDVTLVLQELQYLLQHRLTQALAQAQASTGQDVPEVAALLRVCKKKAVV